ncbi:hypothetical protein OG320_08960 [Microbispora sp. NBC_01189]|uniref:hypothetical protein n=1 Tax=unclassified Microbispora TaxID=2614687 RepID=UPI002E16194A|nr:hypothetical protein OG320_08960 [Microbispora sp. NBC_01189]
MKMTFRIVLEGPVLRDEVLFVDPAEDLEEFDSVIMYSCELLSETDCRLLVGGFGQDVWPVSIDYDLSTILEQLPTLIADLRAGQLTELDFYAQGVQRILDFIPDGEMLRIRCRSGTSWTPEPEFEVAAKEDIVSMLTRLASDFASILQRVAPSIGTLMPFPQWAAGRL